MSPDPSEQTAPVLSPREEWLLLLWMSRHPRAVWEDTTLGAGDAGPRAPQRLPSLAYAVGVAVGTLWLVLRRWW